MIELIGMFLLLFGLGYLLSYAILDIWQPFDHETQVRNNIIISSIVGLGLFLLMLMNALDRVKENNAFFENMESRECHIINFTSTKSNTQAVYQCPDQKDLIVGPFRPAKILTNPERSEKQH